MWSDFELSELNYDVVNASGDSTEIGDYFAVD